MNGTTEAQIDTGLRRTATEILAVSCIVLFQELVLIRWMPSQVRVLSYFPNLILISSFLGIGVGSLRVGRRSLFWLWPVGLLILVASTIAMSGVVFTHNRTSEHLWLLYYDLPSNAPIINSVYPPIILVFVLAALPFVPLGQLLAERLNIFREKSSSLWGYSWDLLGSLLGVLAFTLVGFAGFFPWVWFTLCLAVGLAVFSRHYRFRIAVVIIAVALVLMVKFGERSHFYSPYYAIQAVPSEEGDGIDVLTNGSLHQKATSLRRDDHITSPWGLEVRKGYHAPFSNLETTPQRALVLGAGTGNDVAVLLDEGVAHIDAVEIDPIILNIGKQHPNQPYANDRVRAINTDARNYLNWTSETYDLIVFGTLDSQTRLSALSNVRLDNFVYTRECLEAAKKSLNPGGGVILYFMVGTDFIDQRLFNLVSDVFGEPPLVRDEYSYLFNRVFMAGPAFDHIRTLGSDDPSQLRHSTDEFIELPSDDWPYLYLRTRGISGFYLSLILIFTVISAAAVFLTSGDFRASLRKPRDIDIEMFLFGAAFLLLETKFITSMNLIWGATWVTSAVVFASVLAMILLSTILMELKPLPWRFAATGLLVALLATYLIPTRWLLVANPFTRLGLSVLLVGIPIFFAAACFAMRFATRSRPNLAFGWNLLGAVAGGLLEYLSMAIGLSALNLVAMVFYLVAFLIYERRARE